MTEEVCGRSVDKPIVIGREAMRHLKVALDPGTFEVFNYGRIIQLPCGLFFSAEEPNHSNVQTGRRSGKVRA